MVRDTWHALFSTPGMTWRLTHRPPAFTSIITTWWLFRHVVMPNSLADVHKSRHVVWVGGRLKLLSVTDTVGWALGDYVVLMLHVFVYLLLPPVCKMHYWCVYLSRFMCWWHLMTYESGYRFAYQWQRILMMTLWCCPNKRPGQGPDSVILCQYWSNYSYSIISRPP